MQRNHQTLSSVATTDRSTASARIHARNPMRLVALSLVWSVIPWVAGEGHARQLHRASAQSETTSVGRDNRPIELSRVAGPTPETQDDSGEPRTLPLSASETLSFSVDEGTWMSLDVSPDGQNLVFDLLGDLYTLPIEGGTAKRIFGDISFESQPKFSPDGRSIAFLSDRSGVENLWIADVNGANPRPVSEDDKTGARPQLMSSPSWTDDGDYLLISKVRPPDRAFVLYMYHRDGGAGIRVGPKVELPKTPPGPGTPQPANRLGAVASSDGRHFYYAERKGSFTYNAQFPLWQIHRFDRDRGEAAVLTNAPGSAIRPVLSPQGRYLVYGTRHRDQTGLRVRNLDNHEERWLTLPVTRDDQESRASRDTLPGYAFMPDGESLIVPIGGKIYRVDFATGSRTEIPFRVDVRAEIAPRIHFSHAVDDSDDVVARVIRWAEPSPDGAKLAFSAFNHVWIYDFESAQAGRLTDLQDGEFMPSWSPDGRQLVFATWSVDGGSVYRADIDGATPPTRLTSSQALYTEPTFTPSGEEIVYLVSPASDQLFSDFGVDSHLFRDDDFEIGGVPPTRTAEIRRLSLATGTSRLIGPAKQGRFLHFTQDHERIFFTNSDGLHSVRLDGHDFRTHLTISGAGPGPRPPTATEIRLAPNGQSAIASIQNQHYRIQFPRVGRDPVELKLGQGNAALPATPLVGSEADIEFGNYLGYTADGERVYWSQGNRFYQIPIANIDGPASLTPIKTTILLSQPRVRPKGGLLLKGARIITMRGDEILEPGDIRILNNRIAEVGQNLSTHSGERVIDLSGRTIMPGFVDAHAHMWAPRGVHQTQVWQYMSNLAYGVTTTRDPQTSTDDVFAYMDLIDTGATLGPRVYATGPGVFANIGITDAATAERVLARYKHAYDSKTIKQYVAGDRIVRQWIAMAARKLELTPTTEGALDLKLDLTQMADGYSGHEHSFPIVPIYDDVAQYVARTKTFYTPTILVAYGGPWTENFFFQNTDVIGNEKLSRFIPSQILDNMTRRRGQWFIEEEYIHKKIAAGCTRIVRAGGHCCLGSHGQLQGLGAHWEIWALSSGGLSEHETLRAVTLGSAEAIGLAQDLGSIEAGKLADLIVLNEDPLRDIHNTLSLHYVIRNGEVYEAASLNQIWPEEKPLPTPYWTNWGPR